MGNHYVPQYLLRGFTVDDRLWAHDRKGAKSFPTQPKAIAHETNMYSDELEAYFADVIEGPANMVLDKVRAGEELALDDRIALAHYIVALWKRVPSGRARANSAMPEVAASVRADVVTQLEHIAATEPHLADKALARRDEVIDIIARYQADPPVELWQKGLVTPATSRMVDALLSMSWRWLWAPPGSFLCNDNPVFFFAHEGIGRPTSELTLPLSSNVALWATRRRTPSATRIKATQGMIIQLNRRAAANATRFVFSQQNEPWILPFHLRGAWRLQHLV